MKLASPTLFSPRQGPTRPLRLHLGHKNTHFRSRSASRFSPLASTYILSSTSHSLPPADSSHIVVLPCCICSRHPSIIIHQPRILVHRPRRRCLSSPALNSAARAPTPGLQGNDTQRNSHCSANGMRRPGEPRAARNSNAVTRVARIRFLKLELLESGLEI